MTKPVGARSPQTQGDRVLPPDSEAGLVGNGQTASRPAADNHLTMQDALDVIARACEGQISPVQEIRTPRPTLTPNARRLADIAMDALRRSQEQTS